MLANVRPDAVITWGPEGGTGHPDHRLVSNVVTQLVRAAAPGVPERLYYMYLPVEGFRAMNPERGEPPLLIPAAKHFTVHVPFTRTDLDAARRSMSCHRTQFDPATAERVADASAMAWNGSIRLVPAFSDAPATDVLPRAASPRTPGHTVKVVGWWTRAPRFSP